jgi:hypothetical protein
MRLVEEENLCSGNSEAAGKGVEGNPGENSLL